MAAPIADGRLVRLLEPWCEPFTGYHLYYPDRQGTAAFELFKETLRKAGSCEGSRNSLSGGIFKYQSLSDRKFFTPIPPFTRSSIQRAIACVSFSSSPASVPRNAAGSDMPAEVSPAGQCP